MVVTVELVQVVTEMDTMELHLEVEVAQLIMFLAD